MPCCEGGERGKQRQGDCSYITGRKGILITSFESIKMILISSSFINHLIVAITSHLFSERQNNLQNGEIVVLNTQIMFLEKPHIITSHGTRACRKQDMLLRLFIFSFTISQSFMIYMLSWFEGQYIFDNLYAEVSPLVVQYQLRVSDLLLVALILLLEISKVTVERMIDFSGFK